MCDNYPQGMTRRDYWYLGELPDRYGHYIGEGFDYNSRKYDPDLDENIDHDDDEDDSDDFL